MARSQIRWPILIIACMVAGRDVARGEAPAATAANPAARPAPKTGPILRGRVTDEDGKPLSNVKVVLYGGMATRFRGQEAVTDGQGEYRIEPLKTGALMFPDEGGAEFYTGVQFKHAEYVPADGKSWRDIHVPTDAKEHALDLKMTLGGKVRGIVRDDETGLPANKLGLRIHDGFFNDEREGYFLDYATTDGSGRFESAPLFPGRYIVDVNDGDFKGDQTYPKIGRVEVKAGETVEVELITRERPDLQDPFKITGTAKGSDGRSMVYGGVGVRLVGSKAKLRSKGGGIDGRDVFGLRFGPAERVEISAQAPYGVGTHDVELFGNNLRFGYKLAKRTPSEPLRITDDPTKPDVEAGVRYIKPNQPVEFELIYEKIESEQKAVK